MESDHQLMRVLLALIGCFSISATTQAQGSLPVEVQAELLQQQIVKEVRSGDTTKALSSIDRYRDFGVPMPPALLYAEAALSERNDPGRALAAIEQFLTEAPTSESDRQAALTLYTRVLPVVEADSDAQARHAERVEVRRRSAQMIADAISAAGSAVTASPQPAVLFFLRERKTKGRDVELIVEAGSDRLGQLPAGSWFKTELPAGQANLVIRWADESPSSANRSESVVALESGASYFYVARTGHALFTSKWPITVTPLSSVEFDLLKEKLR